MEKVYVFKLSGDASGLLQATAQGVGGLGRVGEAADQANAQLGRVGQGGQRVGAAANTLAAGAARGAQGVGQLGQQSGIAAYQMTNLTAQINDVVVSLAGGQNPLMVFLQQGSQISGIFGGASNALSAVASLLTPLRVAMGLTAVAAGTLALGFVEGQAQGERYRNMMALTGGAVALTRSDFEQLIPVVAEAANATRTDARTMAESLGGTGRIGGEALGVLVTAALRYQQVSGKTAQDSAAHFAGMASDVVAWAERQNQSMHFATAAQLENIRSLQEQGRTQEAMIEVGNLVISNLRSQGENLGWLERMIRGTSSAWSSFKDALSSIGRPETTAEVLSGLRADLARVQAAMKGMSPSWDGVALTGARRQEAALLQRIADIEANDRDGRVRAANRAVAKREDQERIKRLEKLKEVTDRASGANSQYMKDIEAISAAARAGDIDENKRIELLTQLAYSRAPAAPAQRTPRQPRERQPAPDYLQQADDRMRAALEAWQERDIRAVAAQEERDRQAAQRRTDQALEAAQRVLDVNAQLSISLIADDRQRGLAQIAAEQEQMRQRIDLQALTAEEAKQVIDDLANYRLLRERQLTESLKPEWQRMLEGWRDNNRLLQESWDNTITASLRAGEDAWVRFATTGKLNIKDLVQTIIAEQARLAYRQAVAGTGWLGQLVQGITGLSFGGTSAGTVSSGTGLSIPGFNVPPRADGGSVSARSIYSVVERNEPEVLRTRRGTYLLNGSEDGYVTPLAMRTPGNADRAASTGNVYVSVENNSTAAVQTETQTAPNGDQFVRFVINAAADEVDRRLVTGGSTSRAVSAAFGVQRRPPARY